MVWLMSRRRSQLPVALEPQPLGGPARGRRPRRRAVQGVVGATEGGGDSGHEEQHRQDEYGAAHLARVAEDRRRQPCGAGGCDRRAERRRHPARADVERQPSHRALRVRRPVVARHFRAAW